MRLKEGGPGVDSSLLGCTDEGQDGNMGQGGPENPVPHSAPGLCLYTCLVNPRQPEPPTHTQAALLRDRIHRPYVVQWGGGREPKDGELS